MLKYLLFFALLNCVFTKCSEATDKSEKNLFKKNILKEHNKYRTKNGLAIFGLDDSLCKFSQKHAEKMANENNLYHQSLQPLAIHWRTVGENIAQGQKTEIEVVTAWMNSPGHKANILNAKFTKIGFGKSIAKNGIVFWCVNFGGQ